MSQETWTAVDNYISDRFISSDAVLDKVLEANEAAGLPPHDVSPSQGKFLQLIAQMQNAKYILEIGTLGGYSTIWLARGLAQEGHIVTLEANPVHAEVARDNFALANLEDRIELRLGLAVETLEQLHAESRPPFDLIFIDADKENNPNYLSWTLKMSRPGTVIVADNVVRRMAVIETEGNDLGVQGVQRFSELVASDTRLNATVLQTVGCKGYDGFALIRVLSL